MITHVAIIYNGKIYSRPAPYRHHHVIRDIPGGVKGYDIQGFLDDQGRFLTREVAFNLYKDSAQFIRKNTQGSYQGDKLFSEDLWDTPDEHYQAEIIYQQALKEKYATIHT